MTGTLSAGDNEAAVLGAVLLTQGLAMDRLVNETGLRPGHFAPGRRRIIFEAMVALHDQGAGIDQLTVANKIGDRFTDVDLIELEHLAACPPVTGHAVDYATTVIEHARWRARQDVLHRSQEAVNRRDENAWTAAVTAADQAEPDRGDILDGAALLAEFNTEWEGGGESTITMPFPKLTDAMLGGARPGDSTLISGYSSHGKALDVTTPVPTPDGWKTMLDLRTGDRVYGLDGRPVTVTHAWPVLLDRECFELVFNDGARIVADADHQWTVCTQGQRNAALKVKAGRAIHDEHGKPVTYFTKTLTTRELFALNGIVSRPSVETCAPVERAPKELPVDPYVLGYWLGDGDSRGAKITCHAEDVGSLLVHLAAAGENYAVRPAPGSATTMRVHFGALDTCCRGHRKTGAACCRECQRLHKRAKANGQRLTDIDPPSIFTAAQRLRRLGVLGVRQKHIPDTYLNGSISQRLALMQGLMDSDGSVTPYGRSEFCTTSRPLADGLLALVLGLGIRATMTTDQARLNGRVIGDRYRVCFTTTLPVFRLPRKAERLRSQLSTKATHRTILRVERVRSRPVRCIAVDAPDKLFLAGREHIATHNSLFAIAWLEHVADLDPDARVALYTNEMRPAELAARFVAGRVKPPIPFSTIMRGWFTDPQLADYRTALKALPVRIVHVPGWPWQDIARHQRRHKWDLCCLDLFNRLPGVGKTTEEDEAINGLCNANAQAGGHLAVVAHLAKKRSMTGELDPPSGAEVRGSGMLFNTPANVIFVHQKQEQNAAGVWERTGGGLVWPDKVRNGVAGGRSGVQVFLDSERMRFVQDRPASDLAVAA